MKDQIPTTEAPDSLELARDAINYALGRIRDDVNVQYHMGAFSEAYARLRTAHSALNGISEGAIDEATFSRTFTRKPNAKKLDAIVEIVDSGASSPVLDRIREICRS